MATFTAGAAGVDFDNLDFGALATAPLFGAAPTSVALNLGGLTAQLYGSGFTFGPSGPPTGGVIERIEVRGPAGLIYDLTGLSVSAATFRGWVLAGDEITAKTTLFGLSDAILGSGQNDRLRGYDGVDMLAGGGGDDVLDAGEGDDQAYGGTGADTITDAGGSNYLRGEEGDDYILGGVGFDDINGNQGNDTADGGFGDDWVVGGKDQDLLFGGAGNDLVYGNLGNDTCDGGTGADTLRGGQGDDSLMGGASNDYISGDRGNDTVAGGTGADIFHSFSEADVDRVLDFSVAEGDRVQLDLGTTFTRAQVGADTVLTLSGGGQVILVGVSMSSLLASSIFVA